MQSIGVHWSRDMVMIQWSEEIYGPLNYPKRGPTRPIISINHSFELKQQRTEATHKSSHGWSRHTSMRSTSPMITGPYTTCTRFDMSAVRCYWGAGSGLYRPLEPHPKSSSSSHPQLPSQLKIYLQDDSTTFSWPSAYPTTSSIPHRRQCP